MKLLRNTLFLFAVLLCVTLPCRANQRAYGFCTNGAQPIITVGLNGTPQAHSSYPGCTVTVFISGTVTLATIFKDNLGTALGNPFTGDITTGYWEFYAANGRYDVVLTGAGIPNPGFTFGDILLNDLGPGGGGVPGGVPIQTQVNNSGVFGGTPCENFGDITTGPENVDCDQHSKGPNPWIDITRFGARPCNVATTPCAGGITASISSGSFTATLSSASTFIKGDGVVIYGAGSASGLSTPGAPTVSSVVAQMGVETDLTVAGATGAGTKCYKIIARTTLGGYTPASPETCTNTGQSTLGIVTVNLSSCTRAVTIVTCTTASPTPLLVGGSGGEVYIGTTTPTTVIDSSFRGWRAVTSAADSTHFTFQDTAINTGNGATTNCSGCGSGGTATFFVANHLSWTAVSNAWLYYIYGGASGAETLIGVSRPQNLGPANPLAYTTWDDFTNLMQNFSFPPWIPTAPPTVGANNNLSTTIVSGAGTTTLTLFNAAGATVSNAGIRLDATPAFVAAAAAAASTGVLYIPGGAAAGQDSTNFVINSYCDLTPYRLSVVENGNMTLHETLALKGFGLRYSGNILSSGSDPGLNNWGGYPHFNVFEAVPGMYINEGNSLAVRGIKFQFGVAGATIQNGVLLVVVEPGFNDTWEDDSFVTGSQTTDTAGFGLILRGQASAGIGDTTLNRISLVNGLSGDGTSHNTPFFCNNCGTTNISNLFNIRAGIIFNGNPAGESLSLQYTHYNGGFTPLVSSISALLAVTFSASGTQITMDTVGHQCLAVFGGSVVVHNNGCGPSGYSFVSPSVTGSAVLVDNGASFDNSLGTTFQSEVTVAQSFIFNASGPYGGISVGSNNDSIFVQGAAVPAPTCSVSAGGSVPVGSYQFAVAPTWWLTQATSMWGTNSALSSVCTTTSGNQTITINWTVAPGFPQFMHVFAIAFPNSGTISGGGTPNVGGVGPGANNGDFVPTTTSVVWSSGGIGSFIALVFPHSGPTALMPGTQGIATPALRVQGMAMGLPLPTSASSVQQLAVSGAQEDAYDNFNRGSLGSNWSQFFGGASIGISGNQVALTGGAVAYIGYNPLTFAGDVFAQTTVSVVSTSEAGPGVRQTSANGYFCAETTTALNLIKYLSNIRTQLATTAITGTNGDVLRLEVQGPNLTCTRNSGTNVVTASDTSLGATSPTNPTVGLIISDATARLDNWSAGNLHPFAQLDAEQDWTPPQHFLGPVTIGPTNPIAGALTTGVYSPAFLSQSANPAATGLFRAASTDSLTWRNFANSGDLAFFKTGAASGTLLSDILSATNFGSLAANNFLSGNANPAASGLFRLVNTETISWRNNANNADLAFAKNVNDNLTFAGNLLPYAGAPSTVAGLPTCNATTQDTWRVVTDATAPTYNGTLTGGGAVRVPVYCNGSAWTSH